IPFVRTFLGNENRSIRPALEFELEHRRAVLAWLVRGCLEWQRRGLDQDVPPDIRNATAEYRRDNEALTPFLDECCVISLTARAKAEALRTAYVAWAGRNGIQRPLGVRKFGEALTRRFEKSHANDGSWYAGVGLRESTREQE